MVLESTLKGIYYASILTEAFGYSLEKDRGVNQSSSHPTQERYLSNVDHENDSVRHEKFESASTRAETLFPYIRKVVPTMSLEGFLDCIRRDTSPEWQLFHWETIVLASLHFSVLQMDVQNDGRSWTHHPVPDITAFSSPNTLQMFLEHPDEKLMSETFHYFVDLSVNGAGVKAGDQQTDISLYAWNDVCHSRREMFSTLSVKRLLTLRKIYDDSCVRCLSKRRGVQVCGACGVIPYCNSQCQRKHWKIHKPQCRELRKNRVNLANLTAENKVEQKIGLFPKTHRVSAGSRG